MEREDNQHKIPDITQPDLIQYSDVTTHEIRESDTPPIVDFSKADIKILYEDLGISGERIATIIGVSNATVYNRLRSQGVEVRPLFSDPELEKRRIRNIRKAYEVRGGEITAKKHTPESDSKRSETMKHKIENDPNFRDYVLRSQRLAAAASFIKGEKGRKVKKLVKDAEESARLAKSHAILNSPWFSSLKPRHQEVLRLRYSVDFDYPISQSRIGKMMGGISRQRVHQLENEALARLSVLEDPKK